MLLVEDMPQVAQYIRSLVDSQSKVKLLDVVTDGRNVVEQIRELQPDLLIVDALLQGKMDGLKVASDVREAGFDLPDDVGGNSDPFENEVLGPKDH